MIGGLLTEYLSWRWIFFVNVPVTVVTVALTLAAVPAALGRGGRIMHRFPHALAIGGGVTLIGVGALLTAWLVTPTAGWPARIPGLVLAGTGIGFAGPTLARAATDAVGDARSGMASGAINTARQVGQAFGIALLGSLAATQAAATRQDDGTPDPDGTATALLGGQAHGVLAAVDGAARARLDQALHTAFADGLDLAFVVACAIAVVIGVLVAAMLQHRRAPAPRSAAYRC